MKATVEVCTFDIRGQNYSKMYEKAHRRINSLESKFETTKFVYSFDITTEGGTDVLKVTVYAHVDLKELQKRFCECCKSMHCNFYINTRYNCDRCEFASWLTRTSDDFKKTRYYCKKVLKTGV